MLRIRRIKRPAGYGATSYRHNRCSAYLWSKEWCKRANKVTGRKDRPWAVMTSFVSKRKINAYWPKRTMIRDGYYKVDLGPVKTRELREFFNAHSPRCKWCKHYVSFRDCGYCDECHIKFCGA